LTGRARILGLIEAYERFRQAKGLPATYQVVYAVLEKPL
jgi:malonyl-CoA O-methyltransferase